MAAVSNKFFTQQIFIQIHPYCICSLVEGRFQDIKTMLYHSG